jgi:hypothetical protein
MDESDEKLIEFNKLRVEMDEMDEIDYIGSIDNYFRLMDIYKQSIFKAMNHEEGYASKLNPYAYEGYLAFSWIDVLSKTGIAHMRALRDKLENG